jgi:Ca2+-binding RTX toxin-like protein
MPVRKWGSEQVVGLTSGASGVRGFDVAGLADGGYVVVWEDTSAPRQVLAQRFDALGKPVGGQITVVGLEGSGVVYSEPQVAALSDGGFAICFTTANGSGNAWVNRYAADGTYLNGQGFVNGAVEESQGAVIASETGYRFVFQAGGDIRIGNTIVNDDAAAGVQEGPSVAEIADGSRYVITWVDHNGGHNYRYRVFEANGTAVTASLQVNNSPGVGGAGDDPAVVIGLANGGFVIAWYEFSIALQDRQGVSIHAQIYDSAGGQTGDEFVVNSTFKHHQAFPDLVALPDGGFVAVWSDSALGVNSADYNITGQRFDAFGARVGTQFTVNTTTDGANGEFYPHISALADGRLVVIWRGPNEVRTQIIDARDGLVTGTEDADTLYGHDSVGDEINGLGGDDTLNGLNGDDGLYGGDGDDVLRGGAGADSIDGGAGTDTASYFTGSAGVSVNLVTGLGSGGEAQGDVLTGIENISGSQANDSLVGHSGANTLQGWNGNDVLTGSGGKDTLTGGAGADRFVYGSAAQSPVGDGADLITDFSQAQGDRIDLAAIDASTGAAGDQAFTFIGTALFDGVAGQLRYAQSGGVTTIAGDLNGDKVSDFHIRLTGTIALAAGDFVL